jgi:cytochrome c oxidase subunit 2
MGAAGMKTTVIILSGLLALLPGALLAASEPSPTTTYDYCTLCHGASGGGNVAILAPPLAGIERWYLADQLQAYRQQHRGADFASDAAGTEMRTVARDIGEEEFDAIGNYLAKLRPTKQPATVKGDARRGRTLYTTNCASCHGARAEGNAALHAPALARLNDWYVVATFGKYQQGIRGGDATQSWAHTMNLQASALPANFAIDDVARYLITLGP